jgi:hypothetical protein
MPIREIEISENPTFIDGSILMEQLIDIVRY